MATAAVRRAPQGAQRGKAQPATTKRRTLAGMETPPGVAKLLYSVEEAAYALGIRKRKAEELIARGPDYGGIYSMKIGGRRLIPVWALERYTRPPEAGAI